MLALPSAVLAADTLTVHTNGGGSVLTTINLNITCTLAPALGGLVGFDWLALVGLLGWVGV